MSRLIEAKSLRGLHVLISSQTPSEKIQKIIKANPAVIQLREKIESDDMMVQWGQQVIDQMPKRDHNNTHSLVIVNDRLVVAKALQVDGIHVGQDDLPVRTVREELPSPKLIGFSVSNMQELEEALEADVDYFGVGPVYPTSSKLDAKKPMGIEGFKEIRKRAGKKLLVAIGGIGLSNLREVMDAGADGVAGISFVIDADDPEAVIEESQQIIYEYTKTA